MIICFFSPQVCGRRQRPRGQHIYIWEDDFFFLDKNVQHMYEQKENNIWRKNHKLTISHTQQSTTSWLKVWKRKETSKVKPFLCAWVAKTKKGINRKSKKWLQELLEIFNDWRYFMICFLMYFWICFLMYFRIHFLINFLILFVALPVIDLVRFFLI